MANYVENVSYFSEAKKHRTDRVEANLVFGFHKGSCQLEEHQGYQASPGELLKPLNFYDNCSGEREREREC